MKLFRSYTFSWGQIALFKAYLFVAGLLAGSIWADFFLQWTTVLLIIFVVLLIYLSGLLFKGKI